MKIRTCLTNGSDPHGSIT